jgi:hypothetical protein
VDPGPDFFPLLIPNPITASKDEGIQSCSTLFFYPQISQSKKYLIFDLVRKKCESIHKEL